MIRYGRIAVALAIIGVCLIFAARPAHASTRTGPVPCDAWISWTATTATIHPDTSCMSQPWKVSSWSDMTTPILVQNVRNPGLTVQLSRSGCTRVNFKLLNPDEFIMSRRHGRACR